MQKLCLALQLCFFPDDRLLSCSSNQRWLSFAWLQGFSGDEAKPISNITLFMEF
jgi:hypothetical protein